MDNIVQVGVVRKKDIIQSVKTSVDLAGGMKIKKNSTATSDVIANDVLGLALLKTLGTIDKIQNNSVWEQPQVKRAVELGLGVKNRNEIQIKSDGVKEIENIIVNIL